MYYIVQKGDTLSQIAEKLFNDQWQMFELARINDLHDMNLIFVGQVLNLHKAPLNLNPTQKVVDITPSIDTIQRIKSEFTGFISNEFAIRLYKACIK